MLLRTAAVADHRHISRRSLDVRTISAVSPALTASSQVFDDKSVDYLQKVDDLNFGKLPGTDEQIKSAQLSKLCQGVWLPRYVALTKDQLMIGIPGNETISDRVPLVRISHRPARMHCGMFMKFCCFFFPA
jgi:hypothetical protein